MSSNLIHNTIMRGPRVRVAPGAPHKKIIKLVLEVTFKVLLIKKYQIIIKRVIKKANYEQSTFILIIYQFY